MSHPATGRERRDARRVDPDEQQHPAHPARWQHRRGEPGHLHQVAERCEGDAAGNQERQVEDIEETGDPRKDQR
jgi:hypothetical protein